MENVLKRKATVKFNSHQNDVQSTSRPPSPFKARVQNMSSSSSSSNALPAKLKAKVNSTATPLRKAPSVVSSTKSATVAVRRERSVTTLSTSPTPRAASPFKYNTLKPPPRDDSPASHPKVRATVRTLRPHTAQSVIGSSDTRQRAFTSVAASDVGSRGRNGSVSLQHAASFASLQRSQPGSRSTSPVAPSPTDTLSGMTGLKIKAKVSGLAKQTPVSGEFSPSSPPLPSIRAPPTRARAASITNMTFVSAPPSPNSGFIYPITTATPAANPHRYAPARPHYQPFRSPTSAKVDPASIPLPPHSPPMSSLSVSSKSSLSRSSVQYQISAESSTSHSDASTEHLQHHGKHDSNDYDERLRSTLDDLVRHVEMGDANNTSGESGDDDAVYDDERKARAQAKSNRKIEDLEISNRSLLAINASLEAAKHKQAKEIRDLRRKLRESRLILPPRAYRAVKSSYGPDDEEPDDEGDDDAEGDESEPEDSDMVYKRVKSLIEGLLSSGKRALEAKPETPVSSKSGAKVLSAEEVKSWRESSNSGSDREDMDMDVKSRRSRPSSRSRRASGRNSEEEVETMAYALTPSPPPSISAFAGSRSPPPPILVTESQL
ncbi:hypothetical protein BDN71DRAFT_30315 [Pleurotus eryngii]|uniref:Uncharacterized protein n=1 Tax=Pleurotus eryngii TaxID=5323 RepID=A0A9P6AAD5_PLEER|nr:hypothetical protein BDN71DRAFT_30315 [Pleurotus eryngii]